MHPHETTALTADELAAVVVLASRDGHHTVRAITAIERQLHALDWTGREAGCQAIHADLRRGYAMLAGDAGPLSPHLLATLHEHLDQLRIPLGDWLRARAAELRDSCAEALDRLGRPSHWLREEAWLTQRVGAPSAQLWCDLVTQPGAGGRSIIQPLLDLTTDWRCRCADEWLHRVTGIDLQAIAPADTTARDRLIADLYAGAGRDQHSLAAAWELSAVRAVLAPPAARLTRFECQDDPELLAPTRDALDHVGVHVDDLVQPLSPDDCLMAVLGAHHGAYTHAVHALGHLDSAAVSRAPWRTVTLTGPVADLADPIAVNPLTTAAPAVTPSPNGGPTR